jgi:hypothetical protein
VADSPDQYLTLLEHAIRQWEAEEENARRHATRTNLVLTLTSALLGFLGIGVFRIQILAEADPRWVSWLVKILVCLGLGSLAISPFFVLLGSLRHSWPLRLIRGSLRIARDFLRDKAPWLPLRSVDERLLDSSSHLGLPQKIIDGIPAPPKGSAAAIKGRAALQTFIAASDLARRNLMEKKGIDRSQQFFLAGFLLIMAAMIVYIVFNETATPSGRSPIVVEERISAGTSGEAPREGEGAGPTGGVRGEGHRASPGPAEGVGAVETETPAAGTPSGTVSPVRPAD